MTAQNVGAMKATLGLDVSQFENRAQSASRTAKQMSDAMARAFDVAKASAVGGARSFEELRASIDPTFAATQRYAAIQRELAGMVETGAASQRAANLVLEQAAAKYMGVETAAERTARAQRETSAAADQAARGYQSLLASVNPLYAASKRYEQAQETLTAAVRAGVVSQEQANRVLEQAGAHYLGASTRMDHVSTAAKGMFASVGGGQMALRQTAFQLNQIAQQGAVTGQWMTAFTVQAADMLTVFGLWGILAGGVVALGGPIAMSLMQGAEKAKTAKEAMTDLTGALGDYSNYATAAGRSTAELKAEFGDFGERIRRISGYLAEISLGRALAAMKEENFTFAAELDAAVRKVDDLTGATKRYQEMAASAYPATSEQLLTARESLEAFQADAEAAARKVGLIPEQVLEIDSAFKAVSRASGMADIRDRAAEALAIIDQMFPAGEKLPPELARAYEAMSNVAFAAARAENALTASEAAARGLAGAIAAAAGYSANLDDGVVVLQAKLTALKNQQDANNAGTIAGMRLRAAAYRDEALAAGELNVVAQARYATDMAVIDQQEKLLAGIEAQTKANSAAERASSAAAKASLREEKQLTKEAEKWRDIIDPMAKYTRQQKELEKLLAAGSLTKGEVQQALAAINSEMVNADPLLRQYAGAVTDAVDWMLDGFEGGFKGLLNIAKNTLKQIISMFLTNRITLSLGLGVSGGIGGAVAAGATSSAMSTAGMALSGASLFSNIGSWTSGFIGGITGPLQAGLSAAMQGGLSAGVKAWTASMNASAGGVFGTASMLGTYVGAGLAGLGIGGLLSGGYSLIGNNPMYTTGIGTAAGFLLGGPIGGIIGGALGGVANALFGRKLKDSGLEGRYVGGDFTGNTYQFYKGGVFRSDKTKRKALDPEMQKAIDETLDGMRISVGGAAAMLGAAENALEGFSTSFKFSTKGMSAEEAQAALQEQLGKISDEMVAQIFGTPKQVASGSGILAIFGHLGKSIPLFSGATKTVYELSDEFKALQVTGETATETLNRLTGAFSSANVWMDRLGKTDFAGSLAGAGKAWDFAEVFGGTEAMNEAVAAYYGAFYSDGERLAQAKKELGASLNLLGINTLPTSNKQFRDLVDQAFGGGDNELAAKLIQLAPAMAAITDQTEALTDALEDLDRQSLFATRADARYAATAEGYRAARAEGVTADLLVQLIAAVREGNINLSRLSAAQLAELQRAALDPAA